MPSNEQAAKGELEGVSGQSRYEDVKANVQTRLIEMVYENGLSVYQAATILNLKNSAAKTILRKHKNHTTAPTRASRPTHSLQNHCKIVPKTSQKRPQHQNAHQNEQLTASNPSIAPSHNSAGHYYPFLNFCFDSYAFLHLYPHSGLQARLE